ncbi:MAG: hypothetical protein RL033_1231, partial [Pseudomonadota bacterium]
RSLFGGPTAGDDPALMARLAEGRSVLDLVSRRGSALVNRLGVRDRQRLQRHFDEVRGLENRLRTVSMLPGGGCHAPQVPAQDPSVASGMATNALGERWFSPPRPAGFALDRALPVA